MYSNQIPTWFGEGVRVFGAAVLRVSPDVATVAVSVSRLEEAPESAFSAAHSAARKVGTYLRSSGMTDFGSSRITISKDYTYVDREQRFLGYIARIGFTVVLRDLDRLEEIVSGLMHEGANELNSVSFQTSRLQEVRAEARRRAVAAARRKAELYCASAGVQAGAVLAIDDANPDYFTRGQDAGHIQREPMIDDTGGLEAMDPAAIPVSAAVQVLYEIVPRVQELAT